jgi:nicotinamide-nucleotide amidase
LRLEINGSLLFLLPGVPSEMEYLTKNSVIPYIQEHFSLAEVFKADLFFSAMPESYGDAAIKKVGIPSGVKCIINALPNRRGVIRVRAASKKEAEPFIQAITSELKEYFAGLNLLKGSAEGLAELLFSKKLTFATAESCTGGLAASMLTEIAGISEVFKGGVVSYSNSVKTSILAVSEETLEQVGAVSEQTAVEMVLGVKKLLKTDAALSITGYAGGAAPSTDSEVGKVFIAAAFEGRTICEEKHFTASRNEVRRQAAEAALELARRLISGETDGGI